MTKKDKFLTVKKGFQIQKDNQTEMGTEQKDQRAFKHLKRHLISDTRRELQIKTNETLFMPIRLAD